MASGTVLPVYPTDPGTDPTIPDRSTLHGPRTLVSSRGESGPRIVPTPTDPIPWSEGRRVERSVSDQDGYKVYRVDSIGRTVDHGTEGRLPVTPGKDPCVGPLRRGRGSRRRRGRKNVTRVS